MFRDDGHMKAVNNLISSISNGDVCSRPQDAKYHDVTMPNVLMRVYQDGRVFYSIRWVLTYHYRTLRNERYRAHLRIRVVHI